MSKYIDLDKALLAAIAYGTDTAMKMEWNTALKLATNPHITQRKIHNRVIDGRLQALRKAGKIAYVNRQWHVLGASK